MVKQVKPITEKKITPEVEKLEIYQGNELDIYKELLNLKYEVKKNSTWRQIQQFFMCCSCFISFLVIIISFIMFTGYSSY